MIEKEVSCLNCAYAYKVNGLTYCKVINFEWHIGQTEYTAQACASYVQRRENNEDRN